MNELPRFICHACGIKYGRLGECSPAATFHVGGCDFCQATNLPVTEPRDYGGLPRAGESPAIKRLINEAMDGFDFENVDKAMKVLDWQWYDPSGARLRPPTIEEIKNKARSLLTRVTSEPRYLSVGSGGFTAEVLGFDPDTQAFDGVSLRFAVEETEAHWEDLPSEDHEQD